MQFLIDWIDGARNASAEERATMCDLRIMVGGVNSCSHQYDVGRVSYEAVTVPSVYLAEGIATDWWSIFGGRDREHPIWPYRTGFILPCLSFSCDGSVFEVSGSQMHCQNPGLRFWQPEVEVMPRSEAESVLAGFIESAIERLAAAGVDGSEVELQWARVSESRRDPDENSYCEAAGALGVNPYSITDGDSEFILRSGDVFSGVALTDFLAGVRDLGYEQRRKALEAVVRIEQQAGEHSRLPALHDVA